MSLTMTPTTAAAMASVRRDKAGVGLGGAEQHAPGRRLARDRVMGAIVAAGTTAGLSCRGRAAGGLHARPAQRAARRLGDRARRRSRRGGHAAQAAAPGHRAGGDVRRSHAGRRDGLMSATRPRLTAPERRQVVLEHRVPRLLRQELPRRDDGRDRPRVGHHRADPLPALRLQARPLPRVPRRGVAGIPRGRRDGARREPGQCLGAVSDAYMAKKSKLRLIDLWIQALTEAAEDTVIATAVRRQLREVHDFFADVIRRGQATGGPPSRPRPGRRGLGLHRRRPAGDDRPPPRRPARRRPRARPGRAPGLDGRRSGLKCKRAPAAAPGALSSGGALCVRRPRGTGSAAGQLPRDLHLGAPPARAGKSRPGARFAHSREN